MFAESCLHPHWALHLSPSRNRQQPRRAGGHGEYLSPTVDYTLNVNGARVKQRGYITDELTDDAMDWLKQQYPREKPFFLYLSHKAVHANFTPAPRHEGSLSQRPFQRPAGQALRPTGSQPRWVMDQRNSWHGVDFPYHSALDIKDYYQRYCETLRSADDSIGRIMKQLKAMGIYDETLVIYMGDNGFLFGEHGLIDQRVAYETSIRVPMLIQCPDLFPAGKVGDQVMANIDVAPTILDACGVKRPAHFDGASFIPLAQRKTIPGATNSSTFIIGQRIFRSRPPSSRCAESVTSTSPITACGTRTSCTICGPIRTNPQTCYTTRSSRPSASRWRRSCMP